MRGRIISREYQKIEWVRGEDGKEYACYTREGEQGEAAKGDQHQNCVDLNQVVGDSW